MNYAGRAAGATLGFIVGNVPGAIAGYEYMRRSEKSSPQMPKRRSAPTTGHSQRVTKPYTPPKTPKKKVSKTLKKQKKAAKKIQRAWRKYKNRKNYKMQLYGVSTGANAGKFRTPSRAMTSNKDTLYLKKGFINILERRGDITDSDACYLYHTDYHVVEMVEAIVAALCRSLLRKAGCEVTNLQSELPLAYWEDSSGYRFIYTIRNPITGALTASPPIDLLNNASYKSLVDNMSALTNMGGHLINYMNNASFDEPYAIYMYQRDPLRLAAVIYLQDEMVYLKCQSTVCVQNRSKGADGSFTDPSLDRVDNQPLKGYLYEFKNPDPRLRTTAATNTGMADNNDRFYGSGFQNGCFTFGAAIIGNPTNSFANVPNPKLWKNISKATPITLDPGEIKQASISTYVKHRLPELLKKFRADVTGGFSGGPPAIPGRFNGVMKGKSQIIALEELIRTTSTNLVTLSFEIQQKFSCFTVTKRKKGVLLADTFIGPDVAQQTAPFPS